MSRPIRATVSLAALRHNYWLAKRTAPRSKVLAVLKANAYGHGIERAARALDRADGFATLEIKIDAIEGVNARIPFMKAPDRYDRRGHVSHLQLDSAGGAPEP